MPSERNYLLGTLKLILLSLTSINITYSHYIKSIQDASSERGIMKTKRLSAIIDNGNSLTDLSKLVNTMYGKILAIEYLIITLHIVSGAFVSLNILKALSTFEPKLILKSINGFCIASVGVNKLYAYARVGQHLCDNNSEIKDCLRKLLTMDSICDKQRRELDFLVTRFSATSPIRPMDMFDMNYANCAVLISIMFTHCIILMQFKGY